MLHLWKLSLHLQPLSEKRSLKRPRNEEERWGRTRGVEKVFQQALAGKSEDTTFAVPLAETSAVRECERLNKLERALAQTIQFFDLLSNLRTAGVLDDLRINMRDLVKNQIERTFTMESLILAQDER